MGASDEEYNFGSGSDEAYDDDDGSDEGWEEEISKSAHTAAARVRADLSCCT